MRLVPELRGLDLGQHDLVHDLPRIEVTLAPEDTACPCCGDTMQVIGEDRSQRLDMIPAQYQVIVTRFVAQTRRTSARSSSTPASASAGNASTEIPASAAPRRSKARRSMFGVPSECIGAEGTREILGMVRPL